MCLLPVLHLLAGSSHGLHFPVVWRVGIVHTRGRCSHQHQLAHRLLLHVPHCSTVCRARIYVHSVQVRHQPRLVCCTVEATHQPSKARSHCSAHSDVVLRHLHLLQIRSKRMLLSCLVGLVLVYSAAVALLALMHAKPTSLDEKVRTVCSGQRIRVAWWTQGGLKCRC